jgi:sRNA-binding protein
MIGALQEIAAIMEKPFNKKGLLLALSDYCTSTEYLQATVDQTHRIDLDGNPVQEILELHKQVAAKKLEEREKKRVQQEELKRRQQANIEAAEAKKAAAEKKAAEAAVEKVAKVAKVPTEKVAKVAKVPAAEKEAKPKKVESKPVTVVVKTKKAEPAPTTVVIKTKKIEVPPVSAPSTTAAATEGETGEPVRKKLSLKSKAEKS